MIAVLAPRGFVREEPGQINRRGKKYALLDELFARFPGFLFLWSVHARYGNCQLAGLGTLGTTPGNR